MLELRALHAPLVARTYVAEYNHYEAVNQGDTTPNKPAVLRDAMDDGTWPADRRSVRVVVLTATGVARRCRAEWPEHKMRGPMVSRTHALLCGVRLLLADPEVRPRLGTAE